MRGQLEDGSYPDNIGYIKLKCPWWRFLEEVCGSSSGKNIKKTKFLRQIFEENGLLEKVPILFQIG